jgi:O-antigen/teichoic acid export membrane protein
MIRISDGYLMIMTTAFSVYYLPKLASLKCDKEIKSEILNTYKLVLPGVFISAVVIYIFRYNIISILYSPEFLQMSELFFYQLVGDFFKMGSWVLAYLMISKSMTSLYIISEFIFSALYVFLGFVFLKYMGVSGMSFAFAITYILYFLFMVFKFRNLLF